MMSVWPEATRTRTYWKPGQRSSGCPGLPARLPHAVTAAAAEPRPVAFQQTPERQTEGAAVCSPGEAPASACHLETAAKIFRGAFPYLLPDLWNQTSYWKWLVPLNTLHFLMIKLQHLTKKLHFCFPYFSTLTSFTPRLYILKINSYVQSTPYCDGLVTGITLFAELNTLHGKHQWQNVSVPSFAGTGFRSNYDRKRIVCSVAVRNSLWL